MSWSDLSYQGDPQDLIEAVPRLSEPPAWWRRAACRGVGVSVFFPGKGETYEEAARLCASCPAAQPCIDMAMATPPGEDWGYRAGTTREQRLQLRKNRAA